MSWRAGIGMAFIGMLVWASGSSGGGNEVVILDAPRGAWLASVRSDATIQVLEERDGWRHVRVEGWVATGTEQVPGAAPAVGHVSADDAAPPAAKGSVAATAATAAAGQTPSAQTRPAERKDASIAGVLFATAGMQPSTPGGNLVVHLISDTAALDADLATGGDACRTGLRAADDAIAALEDQVKKALNSSTNFTEATHRYDQAKSELAATKKGRAARAEGCRVEVDTRLAAHAVARVLSSPDGRFEFKDVPAGRYRVLATEHSIAAVRVWSMECAVAGGEAMVLDPRITSAGPDPYAGLR